MKSISSGPPEGVAVKAPVRSGFGRILTFDALSFVAQLERQFGARRREILQDRNTRQKRLDSGELPDFLPHTKSIRDGEWTVGPIPADLQDRRVEITGPADNRKMVINALNSGAQSYMTDFEDACSPTWDNLIHGQINLLDYVSGQLAFMEESTGKTYSVRQTPATLIVRPRGWHLEEAHLEVDGRRMSAGLVDFGLYLFHNARSLLASGTGPYFYLPKLESHLEARLWNDVFIRAQDLLDIPQGSIKSTVLIETLPAAFEMHEILFELRDHIVGLNCGRWDYIFSYIKRLGKNAAFILPDRAQVTMSEAFLNAYSLLLIRTCHQRRAFAMGGMAAQIPVKGDPKLNETAFERVRADKEREVRNGHDGTWVAHPDLVPVAMEAFGKLPGGNQLGIERQDVSVTQQQLLQPHRGERTLDGLRECCRVGLQYLEAWLAGRGAVPLYNLMEDAATAEICRTQLWQWLHHGSRLSDGTAVTAGLIREVLDAEMKGVRDAVGEERWREGHYESAMSLFWDMVTATECEDFLTIPAYRLLVERGL